MRNSSTLTRLPSQDIRVNDYWYYILSGVVEIKYPRWFEEQEAMLRTGLSFGIYEGLARRATQKDAVSVRAAATTICLRLTKAQRATHLLVSYGFPAFIPIG